MARLYGLKSLLSRLYMVLSQISTDAGGTEDAYFKCYGAFVNARIKILGSYRASFGKSD